MLQCVDTFEFFELPRLLWDLSPNDCSDLPYTKFLSVLSPRERDEEERELFWRLDVLCIRLYSRVYCFREEVTKK
jgi:hypothetical protein